MNEEIKHTGTGIKPAGLRTSARLKAWKKSIRVKIARGERLSRRDQRKWSSMCRSAEGVVRARIQTRARKGMTRSMIEERRDAMEMMEAMVAFRIQTSECKQPPEVRAAIEIKDEFPIVLK